MTLKSFLISDGLVISFLSEPDNVSFFSFSKKTNNYEFIKRNLDFYSWDA
jgi:hypothetical protein